MQLKSWSGELAGVILTLFLTIFVGCAAANNQNKPVKQYDENLGNQGRQTMPETEGRIIISDGVDLYIRKIGNGENYIIIPNGLYLEAIFSFLASDDRSFVFYDLRNRGRPARVADESKLKNGILNDVVDMEAVRRHFDAERVTVVGVSYRGLMSVLYALEHKTNLRRLILIGPLSRIQGGEVYPDEHMLCEKAVLPDSESAEAVARMRDAGLDRTAPETYCRSWWDLVRTAYVHDPKDASKIDVDICRYENEWPVNQLRYLERNVLPSIRALTISPKQIRSIDVPSLVIHGKEDRTVYFGAGQRWTNELSDARIVAVPDAAHRPWIENPDLVLDSIDTFIRGAWPFDAKPAE